ncbi:MAG: xecE1 [Glaciihabitans sp.]|jgi:2-keto-3-deoxy-L-fuconate dehydrogenase|nr:xecE1 [Glaciihabitans sp.]
MTTSFANDFEGLVAIVTGGASGIGAATAELLRFRGAKVAIIDRTVVEGDAYLSLACDITNDEEVVAAVAQVASQLGGIDILINNAGIGAAGTVSSNPDDEWRRVLDVNVLGLVRMSRAAFPYLQKSDAAAIVNTCSIASSTGLPNRALYSASKGAVEALTRAMAADYVPEHIRVNAVNPGTADTPWVGRLLDAADDRAAAQAALVARQPMGRLVSAPEVANAIVYLASPLAASTTGTVLAVDGGMAGVRLS